MSGMDTLTCIRRKLGTREPAEPWAPPWPGQTVWVVTRPDWENTEILGVAANVEAAWTIARQDGSMDSMIFWEQDADHGEIYGGTEPGRPYVLVPHELRGA